jgi:hypothetical protein
MDGRNVVDLRFLGKDTQGGGSPTLFDADQTMNGKESTSSRDGRSLTRTF